MPWRASELIVSSTISWARAWTSWCGHLDLRAGGDGVEHVALELALDVVLLVLLQARGDVLAQLGERVEAGRVGGEVVVELGQALDLDLADGDVEGRGLAGQLLGAVLVGEGDLDQALVAGPGADELLLEAGDQPARAELEQLVAALAAVERHAVELAEVVHHDVVAELGGALDGLERGQAVAQALDLGVDRLLVGGGLAALDLDALVGAELGDGAHADLDREGERRAVARAGRRR